MLAPARVLGAGAGHMLIRLIARRVPGLDFLPIGKKNQARRLMSVS